jgi:hypothetical protein
MEVENTSFTSLQGFNFNIVSLWLLNNLQLETLEGLNSVTNINLIGTNKIFNLQGFRKFAPKKLKIIQLQDWYFKSHLLSLMTLPEFKTLRIGSSIDSTIKSQEGYKIFDRAVRVINNHLQGERDVLDCQEQLITEGLKEYACF